MVEQGKSSPIGKNERLVLDEHGQLWFDRWNPRGFWDNVSMITRIQQQKLANYLKSLQDKNKEPHA